MDNSTKTALANEVRRQELARKVAELRGEASASASMAAAASSANSDAMRRLQTAQAELNRLEAGAGPGIGADFGHRGDILAAFLDQAKAEGVINDETASALKSLAGL